MTEPTEDQIKSGTTVYDRAGHKAEYVQPVAGGHLVRPIMTVWAGGGDDVWEEDAASEGLDIWPQVYRKPPTLELHEEAAKLAEEIAAAHRNLSAIRGQAAQAERDNAALFKRLARHDSLRNLEAVLNGSVAYVVRPGYGLDVRIVPFAEAVVYNERYERKDLHRLMTIQPTENGSVTWHLSAYADGSGGGEEVWPATSLEEAQEIAFKIISERLIAKGPAEDDPMWVSAEKAMTDLGIDVPPGVAVKAQAARKKAAAQQLTAAEAALVKAREAVETAKAASKKVA